MAADIFTDTYERLRKAFRASAGRILGNDEEIDDVLQDVFIRLWTKGYHVERRQEAEALMFRSIRNESLDRIRRRKRRPQSFTEAGLEGRLEMDERLITEEEGRQKTAEMTLKSVEAIIEKELTPVQKKILRLHEYEGITLEKIAEMLEMNPPAVRMQLSRLRKTIRECYRRQNENQDERYE